MNCFSPKVINDYQEFARQVIEGANSTKWDNVILEMAPENIHVGRNLDCSERWIRARKHFSNETEPFVGLENIGMNTKSPKQGRCNEDGESLLYICKSRNTAFAEINALIGDVISVGHFIIRKPKIVIDLTGAIWNSSDHKYGIYNSNDARYFLLLLVEKYLKAQDAENIYLVTNYISRILKAANVDGIRYSSTYWKNNNNWVNIALISQQDIEWRYTDQWQITNKNSRCHKYDCNLLKRITLSDI